VSIDRTRFAGACVGAITAMTVLPAGAPAAAGHADTVRGLEADANPAPLGIDDARPRLSWRPQRPQARYRVVVATTAARAARGRGDVWDSGVVRATEPVADYAGPALASRTRYHWSVRVWPARGRGSRWARPGWFETAYLDPGEWQGSWIAGPERRTTRLTPAEGAADDAAIRAAGELCRPPMFPTNNIPNNEGECRELRPAPLLRTDFQVTKPVARARIYSAGLAYNDLTVNGRPAGDRVLDPGFTDYSRTVQYTTLDVTRLLRGGRNVLATELGSGQFDSATRTWDWGWDMAEWRATPRLRLDLRITYADGTEQVVASDGSWRASTAGPRRYDSFYVGETYDARRELPGWDRPGFDATGWAPARVVNAPAGTLRAERQEPIRIVDRRAPGTTTEVAPGVFVHDTGQNLTGWARIRVDAPAGTPIELYYGEKLTDAGRVTDGNVLAGAPPTGFALVGGQLQTDYYVARGTGDEVWAPRFSYKGFQYLQISAPEGRPLPEDVTVSVEAIEQVRTDLRRTSRFSAGNALLERIHRNTLWAVQNNIHGVVTDTPELEKNAWTGDAALTAGTAALLFDTERLTQKQFQDMVDAQTEQGEVPLLAPSNEHYGYVGKPAFKPPECCGATPPWDAFWFFVPWEAYQRYGDRRGLEQTYPAMTRYLDDWIPRWTDKDGDAFAHTLTAGLGDWDPPVGTPTNISLSATAYYARFAQIAAAVARVLGRSADAARYDALSAAIRTDFNARFLGADGIYRETPATGFTQTAQILPLAFGLAPDAQRAAIAARLAADIRARGGNAYVGILGARYVLPVLSDAGYADLAYTVATQTDYPSWGYWIDVLGWTSLGEYWEATSRSRNHHFFGTIVQWLYEDLAGIKPHAPGYRRIEFAPQVPAGLDRAAAAYDSVLGTVESSWRRRSGGLELAVRVPPGATGRVLVPAGSPRRVDVEGGARPVGVEAGRVVYEAGPGRHRFRVRSR